MLLLPLALLTTAPAESPYLAAVRDCLDRLLEHGTDRYGEVHTPMLMSVIDVRTGTAPREPELHDSYIRSEERPGRRNPGGCDLWDDGPLLKTLVEFGQRVGDPRYESAVDAYITAFCARARKENGLLGWGSHLYYDAYTESLADDRHGHVHEILVHDPDWSRLHHLAPEAVRAEIEGIWQWHIVDHETGYHNRHDDGRPGLDFAFSGGSFATAFAFWSTVDDRDLWLARARLVADNHWRHRDPVTGLVADTPGTPGRYDAEHCFTTIPGPHAAALLRCFALTGETWFRDVAVSYIKAFDRYAWDEEAGQYYAALKLDGTPVPEAARGEGYDAWMPTGYVDIWPTTIYAYEWPLLAAQASIYAYERTGDAALLDIARRWARDIRGAMPPAVGRRWRDEVLAAVPGAADGTYAEGYGRAISFFCHLHAATGDAADLATARELADDALAKLGHDGWLVGLPGKPYYEAVDGVGVLLYALLELSLAPELLAMNL